ncbi:MAG: GNAT family N-acetyltransferase [Clostridia bacterium]|nr:GNAT family N-acetyltransferase [Clostridia bacterium]
MKIEIAKRDELPEILALQYLAYRSEAIIAGTDDIPPLKQTLEEVQAEYEVGTVFTVKDGERIVGSVRIKEKDGTVYVGKLMVHPDYRRRGIGTAMLQAVEKHCPNRRYELFTNTTSVSNIRLYTRLGYKIFAQREIRPGMTFVYLEKN